MVVKMRKKDEETIHELAKTDTLRELARVLLSYMTVEQVANFLATIMVMRARGEKDDNEIIDYYVKDQFFSLAKILAVSAADLLPDMITDFSFMKKASHLYGENFKISKVFDFFKRHDESKKVGD